MSLTLKVEGVSKQFGKQEVLANVNLEMRSGQIYGLVGRNGSGKTVLMKLLCGLLPPSSGAIWVDGKPVIEGLERVSKPSCRVHCGSREIPRVRNGLGTVVLTTPKGIMSGRQAAKENVGGEILCYVW